jgi:hypothetical protein
MSIIALTSASGAPGVTTAALGLTLTWNRSVIMVDADPGAYQAVLAGYLRGQLPTGKGLQRVAEAHRDGRPLAEVVSDETVPLTDQPASDVSTEEHGATEQSARSAGPSRRLLPGFLRPANAGLFGPVWPDLMEAFAGFDQAGIDVIVDLGRMDRQGLPQPLLDRADLVLLVLRTSLRSIAAARSYAAVLRDQSRLTAADANLGLVLIGEGRPYGRREIAKLLNLPVVTALADDPESASTFSDGARRERRFDRAPLPRSLHRAVDDLTDHIRRRRVRLGLDESPAMITMDAPDGLSTGATATGTDPAGSDGGPLGSPVDVSSAPGRPPTDTTTSNGPLPAGTGGGSRA